MATEIAPLHLYYLTHSSYRRPLFLVCIESDDGNICFDDSREITKGHKVFGRAVHARGMFQGGGHVVRYGKVHVDQIEYDYTMELQEEQCVRRIERYWLKYRTNYIHQKAARIIQRAWRHWVIRKRELWNPHCFIGICNMYVNYLRLSTA